MSDASFCKVCGTPVAKHRSFCSLRCNGISMRGQTAWNKGQTRPKTAMRMPCRICGEPTKYYASDRRLAGLVTCGQPECVEQSRALKNARISATQREDFAAGRGHARKGSWGGVPQVSKEETILSDWFVSLGWTPQHRVLTGVHSNKLPRMFRLDFALPDRMIYVEIDGTVHRHRDRRERDERRDAMLSALGWRGLRLPAKLVREDQESAKSEVLRWVDTVI